MKLAISRRTPPGPLQSHQLHQKRVSAEPIKGKGLSSHTHTHTRCCIWLELIRGIFLPSGNRNTTEGDGGGKRWVGDVLKLKLVHEQPPTPTCLQ